MRRLLDKIQTAVLRAGLIILAIAGFFAVGFVPTFLLGTPHIGFVLAVLANIPFGMKGRSLPAAIGWAILLGLIAGTGITWALDIARQGEVPRSFAAIYIGSTTIACTVTAGLFFRLAQRRKKLIDDQWK